MAWERSLRIVVTSVVIIQLYGEMPTKPFQSLSHGLGAKLTNRRVCEHYVTGFSCQEAERSRSLQMEDCEDFASELLCRSKTLVR